ncbi:MAG: translocation/assembly module TamB domain-containing protein [Saprospiraceae bacterium]|nr:translocation/assembly module TamB domain-containing protein [Saprospiraceae bacterium]
MTEQNEKKEKVKTGINIPTAVRNVVLLLLMVPFLFLGLMQLTVVQNWTANKITKYFSAKTGMDVTVRSLNIHLVKGIVLNDLIIKSESDTMLMIHHFDISLRKNLLHLFSNKLDLSEVGIEDSSLNILTRKNETESDFDKFLTKLISNQTPNTPTKKKSFDLGLKDVRMRNIRLFIDDENKGLAHSFYIKSNDIRFRMIDLECNNYDIEYILLNGLEIRRIAYDEYCPVEKNDDKINIRKSDINATESIPLHLVIGEFKLTDGVFSVNNNLVKPELKYKDLMDFNHFEFSDINLLINSLNLTEGNVLDFDLKRFDFKDDKGFELTTFECDSIHIDPTSIRLPDYIIRTPRSVLKESLSFSFSGFDAFSDFVNNIALNATFTESSIYLGDLAHFVKALKGSTFLINNSEELLKISGRYYGKIANIGGRDVDFTLGDKLSLAGSFNTRDLTDPDNALLNIKLDRFQTSMQKLKRLVPGFTPPENFYKIGSINFTGRFDGYFEDFVAYGKLRSDIGTAEMDMRLDVKQGTSRANYSGKLNLINFNLGKWSDNSDFGLVNFNSIVQNGYGLTLNTLKTDLKATVKSINFKKYNYNNFVVEGQIEKNIFNGELSIHDPNIDFIFKGSLEYLNKQAFLNFKSEVKRLDLNALNLSEIPLAFSGNMDIDTKGSNINDILGDIDVSNLMIETKDTSYFMDQIKLKSRMLVSGKKQLEILSDLGRINLEGDYDLPNVVKSVKKIISSNYPYLTKTWKFDDTVDYPNQEINFDIQMQESKNFLDLAGLQNAGFNKFNLKGRIDTYKNEISFTATAPLLKIGNDSLKNLQLIVSSDARSGDIFLHIDSTYALGNTFKPIDVQVNMKGDTIGIQFSGSNLATSVDNVDLKGRFIPHPNGYELNLKENELKLFDSTWKFSPDNKIILGKHYFDISDLSISDGQRRLLLRDIDNKGLNLIFSNFNLNLINPIINYDKMSFAGMMDVDIELVDIFAERKDLSALITMNQLTINKDPYGPVSIFVSKFADNPFNASFNIGDFVAVNAVYNEENKQLSTRAKLKAAPLYLLQYLLKDGIDETDGHINAELIVAGPLDDLKITGSGSVHKAKTKLKYTGVTYFFDNQKITLNEKLIDLTGAIITDGNNNQGVINGGLTHNVFRNFGVNATISGNNVIALNTTKADNPNYYGYAVGNLSASFIGHFDNVDMAITGVTGPGTKLFIPVGNSQSVAEENFIRFFKKDEESNGKTQSSDVAVKGINIELNLTITPDAELSIIFDESRGDIIRGTGRGNLQMFITRKGDFDIFGEYQIEQGEYLFTVALLPVAKPFVVKRGGVIRWTGDPVNASLDIEASYQMRTSVRPFIEEYLPFASAETVNQANQRSEVELKLKLGGTLFQPDITFDLAFQNLVGELANFVDSKLRLLKNNELELNSQVLGLIVFNSFLPSNRVADAFGAGSLQSAGINTLSEFVSSQLSLYLTSLLNTALEENGFIAGIDFEVGLRNNTLLAGGTTDNRNIFPDEIEIRVKNRFRFLDERLSLNVGGNYVLQNQGFAVNQILPDFALELIITEDRKLKARLYGKTDLDVVAINSLRQKYGLGLGYRTEFGSMVDFEKKLKQGVGQLIEKQN